VFSFGAVFYEMLTGKRAFEGQSNAAVLAAVIRDDPRAVSAIQVWDLLHRLYPLAQK
jgi:serine/threonine protein kinase